MARREETEEMIQFKFDLGDRVSINVSGERGVVVSRANHLHAENQYNVLYKAADGRAVEAWWYEESLSPVKPEPSNEQLDDAN